MLVSPGSLENDFFSNYYLSACFEHVSATRRLEEALLLLCYLPFNLLPPKKRKYG